MYRPRRFWEYNQLKTTLKYKKNSEAVTISQIKNARAVITATKMFEGQPRLLCEASSLGIPSIYPSFGGMDDFFPDDAADETTPRTGLSRAM